MVSLQSKKREVKQKVEEPSTSIVLGFHYDMKFILPIEQGRMILEALASARGLKETYGKNPDVLPSVGDISVKYMAEEEIQALVVTKVIQE